MSTGTPISLPVNTDGSYQVALLDQYGNPVTTFTTADTPFAQVWAGQDTLLDFSPQTAWISAPAGTVSLTITAASTTNILPGKYRLRVGVRTAGGQTVVIPDTFVELTSSPGSAAVLPTYCTLDDLLQFAPWIEEMQSVMDQTGFAVERNRARQWVDRVIQRNRNNSGGYGSYGVGAPMVWGYGWFWAANGQDNPVLQGYLDQDLLMTAPPKMVSELAARKTLGYICKAQVGPDDKDTAWQVIGHRFDAEAEEMAMRYIAEIDLNADGYADIVITCGRASLR